MTAAKILLITIACAWLAAAAYTYFVQDRLLFHPRREFALTPAERGYAYEDVWLTSADGVRLHAWYVPAGLDAPTVLFLHGNAGNIADRPLTLACLHGLGLHVLMLDYRGYGRSEGVPSAEGTREDARAAWRYLTETRATAPRDIIIYGRSLGGAVALALGAETASRAMIVESTFTSLAELAADAYPYLPVRLLLRHRYASSENIARITAPILVAHSPDDEVVPFAHGERLFERATGPRSFYRLRGAHNQAFVHAGEAYCRALGAFIDEAGAIDASSPVVTP